MPDIFHYSDYRKFLHDWYTEKKSANPSFSYRLIAQQVGYSSPGYLHMVISGKSGISLSRGMQFAAYMKLKKREMDYFQYLILFGEAKTDEEKLKYFEKMRSFKEASVYTLNVSQYKYYEKWYHSVIRALLDNIDFKDEYKQIGSLLLPAISAQEAEESISILKELHLIQADDQQYLRPTDSLVSNGYDVPGSLLNNSIINYLRLSEKAIDFFPKNERNFSVLTLAISEAGFTQIQQELREFRRKIMQIAANDSIDRIYQLGFQLFPVSHKSIPGSKKR